MLKAYDIQEIANKKVHGRTVQDASPLPLFWNHSGVEVNCDGSELWIDLEVDHGFHEPWIAIELNGALMSRRMLLKEDRSVCLFRSMTPGVVKNVKFYREIQAMSEDDLCHVLVKGFRTDGNFFPVPENDFKLEFIGDSVTSGEGTYGANGDTDWLAMYMSSSRHYANIIEKAMKADVRIISQGGWGVYSGWDNDVRHQIPKIYEPVCGLSWGPINEALGAGKPNDYAAWKPDAIIVNLGTNDNSSFNTPPLEIPGMGTFKNRRNPDGSFVREDLQKFIDAVYDFLLLLRRLNPTSHILWAYGMLGNEMKPAILEAMDKFRADTGDDNVAFLDLPNIDEVTVGSHGHPGYKSHIESARVLGEYLSQKFGREYREPEGNL
ncbi:MAG: GDSL family lipase [Lachnospiraceae bacterium]|nr:GDSL family lipase [Lachnospiraceae bacterium]